MNNLKFQAIVLKSDINPYSEYPGIDERETLINVADIHLYEGKIDCLSDEDGNEYSYQDKTLKEVVISCT